MMNWIKIILGILFFSCVVFMLFVSNKMDENIIMSKPKISIQYNGTDAILTQEELIDRLTQNNFLPNHEILKNLKYDSMEVFINQMPEVKNCDVYKEIGKNWNLTVELRHPIARIIDQKGHHFYLDEEGFLMKRAPNIVARTIIYNGHIPNILENVDDKALINKDSLISNGVIQDIYSFSNYVCDNPFFQALISQVYVNIDGSFDIIPLIGDYIIKFGLIETQSKMADKMFRLECFLKNGLPFEGWEKYIEINLNYDGQIVCRKRK